MSELIVWLVFGLNLLCAAVNLCTLLDARRRIRIARAEEAAREPTDWDAIVEAELSGPEGGVA